MQGDVIFIVFTLDICRGFASNKIGMFLLQILNETNTATGFATAAGVDGRRAVRAEVEGARAVAIVLSGRPIVAAALHFVHKRAVAVACGR